MQSTLNLFSTKGFPLSVMVILSLLIASCGYQLRGVQNIPDVMKRVNLNMQNVSAGMESTLRQQLHSSGMVFVRNADMSILIENERLERRELTLDSTGRVAETEMVLEVDVQFGDRLREMQSTPSRITARRNYSVDSDNVTTSGSQERLLLQQMYNEVAQEVLRRYVRFGEVYQNSEQNNEQSQ